MTRFVSTAWVARGSAEFESGAALRVHAKAQRATAAHPMHIYFLEGLERLEEPYVAHLRDANIHLHDASAVMSEVQSAYAALNQIANPYDVRCFVRWFIIERLCPGERLVHFDLDLFFKTDLSEMATILAACEGTLGSPCLTIATPEWLRIYRQMVDRLISDRGGLEQDLQYGGTKHRMNIASDQDLTQALERRGGILPQSSQGTESWAIITNPLWAPQEVGRPTVYTPNDRFGDRPVLYWHLQNGFSDYLSRFASLKLFPHPYMGNNKFRLGNPDFMIEPSAENIAFHRLKIQAYQRLQSRWLHETALSMPHSGNEFDIVQTRAWVANAFIVEGRFREIFTRDWWWDPDGFVAAEDTIKHDEPEPALAVRAQPETIMPAVIAETPVASPPPSPAQAEATARFDLPANVFIDGDPDGNVIIVEHSDRHIHLVISLRGKGNRIIVRRDCALDAVLIVGDGASVEIGERTRMHGVRIIAEEGATCLIGARCLFANGVEINASDGHRIFDQASGQRINPTRPIRIGDDVRVDEYAHLSTGCTIGADSIVAASAMLDGDYPASAIIAGSPAKVLRTGIKSDPLPV
jgi:acetyltransferase-like isoleucine patch superfamily enzyme